MTAPIRRTLVRLPADPARTDVKLGQRAPYEGEWVERPYLPVMPATTAAEAAAEQSVPASAVADHDCLMPSACGVTGFYCSNTKPSAAADLAALRALIWYRGDLAGELA